MNLQEALSLALKEWRFLEFKEKNNHEASSACPFCRDGVDRFLVFDDGGFWCRQCGTSGFLGNKHKPLTDQELTDLRLRRLERDNEKLKKRLSALEVMMSCTDHLDYHSQLDDDEIVHWEMQGISAESARAYKLGICYRCPTDYPQYRPSRTIPVFDSKWKSLLNIRHRLVDAKGDRYRPHMPGLGTQLFNSRFVLSEKKVLLVEGAKKSIVCSDRVMPTVATMGTSFNLGWLAHFKSVREFYIGYDPDAYEKAWKVGVAIKEKGLKVYVCNFPVKPDDLFTLYGGTESDFLHFVSLARRV